MALANDGGNIPGQRRLTMADGAGERRRQHPRAPSLDDGRWRWRTTAATSQGTVVGRWPMALANDGGNIPGHRRWTVGDGRRHGSHHLWAQLTPSTPHDRV